MALTAQERLMPTVVLTPISSGKAYCWHRYVRGVVGLSTPPEEIFWLFVVQEQGLTPQLTEQIAELKRRLGERYAGIESIHYRLPFADEFFDPRTDRLTWRERALFAAHLRAVGFQAARDFCPEFTHLLSLGCDVCLTDAEDVARLKAVDHPLVSGVLLARLRQFPLVLTFDRPSKSWESWVSYPREAPFVADWTGMDILLMERFLTEQIDLFQFTPEAWEAGEDAWFCLQAADRGVTTMVHPGVTPEHIHHNGTILWAGGEHPPRLMRYACPHCGLEGRIRAYALDHTISCADCRNVFVANPWWQTPVYEETPVDPGFSSLVPR
jgi:hypothetical protein